MKIGKNVVIMKGAVISDSVSIGNNVTIYQDTRIGKNTVILDNCVLGRSPFDARNISRKPKKSLRPLVIGPSCKIGPAVVLYRGSSVGAGTMICEFSSVREECRIGRNAVLGRSVLLNYNVKIGDNSRIMDGCHFGGDMVIEEDVFMGPFVSSANDKYFGMKDKTIRRGARIKKRAKIGVGVILLGGITIGEGAVIGAGSLVNKDIPKKAVAWGSPVRVMRRLKSICLSAL